MEQTNFRKTRESVLTKLLHCYFYAFILVGNETVAFFQSTYHSTVVTFPVIINGTNFNKRCDENDKRNKRWIKLDVEVDRGRDRWK